MNAPVFFESAGDDRGTPQALFDALHQEFKFDGDAAAHGQNAKLPLYMGPGGAFEDALAADWGGLTWYLNPPYSLAQRFVAKAREEADRGARVVLVLPVRSDTKWWHRYIWDKDAPGPSQHVNYLLGSQQPSEFDAVPKDGNWRPGVRGRFLPGRLEFELKVPQTLRDWIKDEHREFTADPGRYKDTVEWLKEMSKVTGLPRMAVERILEDKPDSELLDSAPFPSCVIIFEPGTGGTTES